MSNGFMTVKEAAVALVSHTTGRGPVNGSFATKLIEAFERADRSNIERLLLGFPEFRFPIYTSLNQGVDILEEMIKSGQLDNMK